MKLFALNLSALIIALSISASAANNSIPVQNHNEQDMLIEEWMFYELMPSCDVEMNIEEWMFGPLVDDTTEELRIEEWMLEEIHPSEENAIYFEDWMFGLLKDS